MMKVKQEEQDLMMEALGLKPKVRRDTGKALEKHEFKELCKRGTTQRDETDIDRSAGLGFAPAARIGPDGIEVGAPMPSSRPREQVDSNLVHADQIEDKSPLNERPANSDDEDTKHREKKHKKEKKDKKEKKHKKEKERKRDRHSGNEDDRRERTRGPERPDSGHHDEKRHKHSHHH